jgi:hypothetical protein
MYWALINTSIQYVLMLKLGKIIEFSYSGRKIGIVKMYTEYNSFSATG